MNEYRPPLKISKLDAATRQLRSAIRLFFEEADEVSIHTLIGASHEMTHSLVKRKGGSSLLKDNPYIRPEKRREYEDRINEARNFFKHASRDAHKELEFYPDVNRFWIHDTIMMHRESFGAQHLHMDLVLFLTWFTIEHPDLLNPETQNLLTDNMKEQAKKIRESGRSKSLFLNYLNNPKSIPTFQPTWDVPMGS